MAEEIYYSFITRDGYKGDLPKYFEKEDFEWYKDLEENWLVVKQELLKLVAEGSPLKPYFDQGIVSKKNHWKTIPFFTWGVKYYKNQKRVPETTKLLNKIPGLVSASFNFLDANTTIEPHYGDTSAAVRCHLGLVIPGELPEVGFEVEGEKRSWKEGELLFFCDARNHMAWNNSKEERYILLFDVIRPEFIKKRRVICSNILASFFLQSLANKISFLKKMPLFLQFLLYKISIAGAFFFVPIRNFFDKLTKGS